jgi:hypothetical protein
MVLRINTTTALTAANKKTEPVAILTGRGNNANQEFHLQISGTWVGTISILRKIRDINDDQPNLLVHSGADNAAALTFVANGIVDDELIGMWVRNEENVDSGTTPSMGLITDNTSTVITATLAGGTENKFDIGDQCSLWEVVDTYTANASVVGTESAEAAEYLAIMSAYTSGTARVVINQ